MKKATKLSPLVEAVPFFNQVRRTFLLFRILAQYYRYSEGRDELSAEEVAKRLKMRVVDAKRAIKVLHLSHCIEIASKGPGRTVWRFIPDSTAPDELAVQTFAQAKTFAES